MQKKIRWINLFAATLTWKKKERKLKAINKFIQCLRFAFNHKQRNCIAILRSKVKCRSGTRAHQLQVHGVKQLPNHSTIEAGNPGTTHHHCDRKRRWRESRSKLKTNDIFFTRMLNIQKHRSAIQMAYRVTAIDDVVHIGSANTNAKQPERTFDSVLCVCRRQSIMEISIFFIVFILLANIACGEGKTFNEKNMVKHENEMNPKWALESRASEEQKNVNQKWSINFNWTKKRKRKRKDKFVCLLGFLLFQQNEMSPKSMLISYAWDFQEQLQNKTTIEVNSHYRMYEKNWKKKQKQQLAHSFFFSGRKSLYGKNKYGRTGGKNVRHVCYVIMSRGNAT